MVMELINLISKSCIKSAMACSFISFYSCNAQKEFGNKYLVLEKTIALPGVNGRIDHLAIDEARKIVYIAALGNNTVEVVDLAGGKVVHTIKGFSEPQGIEYLSFSHSVFVANGGTGVCNFFDATTFRPVASLNFEDDADDVRYLSNHKTVYVGYGEGSIGVIDEGSQKEIGRISFTGHPEGFQVDPKTKKVWVNVPGMHRIEVLDANTFKVIDHWKMNDLSANFPMAYDSLHHRLFIGCRAPAVLVVFDSETGRQIASLPCAGDTDDLFYDAFTKRIIVSGGNGYIDIFKQ